MSLLSTGLAAGIGLAVVRHKKIYEAAAPYRAMINEAAGSAGVSPCVLAALLWQESNFSSDIVGSSGEYGMSQITPAALEDINMSKSDIEGDARAQINAGAKFLALQIKRVGDVYNGLRAYNAGAAGSARDMTIGSSYAIQVLITALTDYLYGVLHHA